MKNLKDSLEAVDSISVKLSSKTHTALKGILIEELLSSPFSDANSILSDALQELRAGKPVQKEGGQ